jgi:hypothetical protein
MLRPAPTFPWNLAPVACTGPEGAAARKVLFSSPEVQQLFLRDLQDAVAALQQAAPDDANHDGVRPA